MGLICLLAALLLQCRSSLCLSPGSGILLSYFYVARLWLRRFLCIIPHNISYLSDLPFFFAYYAFQIKTHFLRIVMMMIIRSLVKIIITTHTHTRIHKTHFIQSYPIYWEPLLHFATISRRQPQACCEMHVSSHHDHHACILTHTHTHTHTDKVIQIST